MRPSEYTFDRYLNIRSALSPALSPHGRRVAFLSDISGTFQAWSTGLDSDDEARWPLQLTFFADKVWELHGTPNAEHLIAVGDVGGNERQQLYLISNYGTDRSGHRQHDVRRLTSDGDAIHRFGCWSSDGQAVVYTSNARNGVDFDLYWLDVRTGASRLLLETAGNRTVAALAPDDSATIMVDDVGSEQSDLYLVDLSTGHERHLTAGEPPARYRGLKWTTQGLFTLTDRRWDTFALCRLDPENGALDAVISASELLAGLDGAKGELDLFSVTKEAEGAFLALNVEGYSRLFYVDLQKGSHRPLTGVPTGVITSIQGSSDGRSLCFDIQTPTDAPDIWSLRLPDGACRQVTFSNRAGIARKTMISPQVVRFRSFDDEEIPALYFPPQQPMPAEGYPCILYVHGGPASQQRPDFDVRFQYFLRQGYAILATNVRGSTGYGRAYMMMDDVEKRMDSVIDLKYAVLWLRDRADINAERIALYGRSYGGFMVLAALTEYPHLFAAGINVVGIANWVTFLERTSPWRRAHREREYGSLAGHRALLEQISPIHRAERIQMPLLVLAGDNDPRVPLYESEQIVRRVRDAGGEVEFIHYADEGHRFSKLANRIDSFTRMAAFLRHALG